MSAFEEQDKMADYILKNYRGKVLAIVKATRAGATFSLLKRACELEQKTTIVAPYIKIFDETVTEVIKSFPSDQYPTYVRIAANKDMCKKVQEKIIAHPNLRKFPFHVRPTCKNCEYNDPGSCLLQEILSCDDWDVIGITYAKLKHLCYGNSEIAQAFLEKIRLSDNLILDEFTTGILATLPSVEIEQLYSRLQRDFHAETRMLEGIGQTPYHEGIFWSTVGLFASEAEGIVSGLKPGEHRICKNGVTEEDATFFEKNSAKCWSMIERLTIEGHETSVLQQIMQVIGAKTLVAIKSPKGKTSVQPVEDMSDHAMRSYDYLKSFIKPFSPNGKLVALVDACLPDLDLPRILESPIACFNWGDPLETNKSQLIVCDTAKVGKSEFFTKTRFQEKLKDLIKMACKLYESKSVMVVTLSSDMSKKIKEDWIRNGEIPEVFATHYRSEFSRGYTIDRDHRILVLVGAPYLPKLSYLAETYQTDLMTAFQRSDERSAFVNMIGRIKDPQGEMPSIVYALGLTIAEVKGFVEQKDIPSPYVLGIMIRPAKVEDFFLTSMLFWYNARDRWLNMSEDLPLLVRIIRKCQEHGKVQCSEIVSSQTKRVQTVVEEYADILEKYGIKMESLPRGMSLVYSKS